MIVTLPLTLTLTLTLALTLNPNYLHQVLTKENEQVFSYFMLKPKPAKGRMGRMLSKMKPKQWFSHSMLLVRGQG